MFPPIHLPHLGPKPEAAIERDAEGNPVALNPSAPLPVAAAVQIAEAAADPSAAGDAPGPASPSDAPAPAAHVGDAYVTVGHDESPHDLATRLGHPGEWARLIEEQSPSWWAELLGHMAVPPATADEGVRAVLARWTPGLELAVPKGWDAPEPEPEPAAPLPTEQVVPDKPAPAFWEARAHGNS